MACAGSRATILARWMASGTSWLVTRSVGAPPATFTSLWVCRPSRRHLPLEFGQIWTDCAKSAIGVTQTWGDIMGPSVHAVKLNDHFFPKYVWDKDNNCVENRMESWWLDAFNAETRTRSPSTPRLSRCIVAAKTLNDVWRCRLFQPLTMGVSVIHFLADFRRIRPESAISNR